MAKKGPTAYMKQGSVSPVVREEYTGKDWVLFGLRNLWPEQLRSLADNCAPLEGSMQALAHMIAGEGITFHTKSGEEIPEATAVFDKWMTETTQEEFLFNTAYDIAFLNAFSWTTRGSASDMVRLDHLDVSRVRSGKLEEDGKPSRYFWCADWRKQGYKVGDTGRYKVKAIERYQGKMTAEEALIYSKGYTQGPNGDIYGVPWWTGIIKTAEVWASVDAYNKTQIDTGFAARMHLHTYTNKDEKDLEEYDKRIMDAYTGSMGRGLFHTYGTPEEGAPLVTPLQRGDGAGELDEMRDAAANVIYSGYGIPKILMGVDTTTGMNGAANALRQAHQTVMKMLVKPKQQMITKTLVRLMNEAGLSQVWEARIEQVDLINEGQDEVMNRQAYMAAVTKNEHRESVLDLLPLDGEQWNTALNVGGEKVAEPDAEQPSKE